MSNLFIVGMGIGTVFLGLICIVLLCCIVSALCRASERKNKAVSEPSVTAAPTASQPIQNRQEIIAAVAAAAAEDMGTDISAIRILSFKKI